MNFQEITILQRKVIDEIISNPENAFSFFTENWMSLDYDDKKTFGSQILRFCNIRIYGDFFPEYDNLKLQQNCCAAIYNYIDDEINGRVKFGNLKLGDGITPKDITAVFKLMKDLNYIDNTLAELEQFIIRVFGLKDNTTIDSYLNDNGKLQDSARAFKKAVDGSNLIRGEFK
jgi:hypothetical protein